ncbi:endonuclease domain-containing protein [bacterium]|nr:endonuclease domain-containing protein [bacterium]
MSTEDYKTLSSPPYEGGDKGVVGKSSKTNRPETKRKRQFLRSNMTRAEIELWKKLKNKNLGFKFRRQYGFLNYIIDFYCPEVKLAIEIIGDVHGFTSTKRKDFIRSQKIRSHGIKILTYTNMQVLEEMEGVLNNIVSNLPPTPSFIRRGRTGVNHRETK